MAPLRAFEVEIALCADDSGDSDWVINYSCPACEAAEQPAVMRAAGQSVERAEAPAATAAAPLGVRPNAIYDPAAP